MAKTERYRGYHIDLERLATRIEAYLQENGFEVAFSKEPSEKLSLFFIQARKYGAQLLSSMLVRDSNLTYGIT